jgi:chromosome segregation ATPase
MFTTWVDAVKGASHFGIDLFPVQEDLKLVRDRLQKAEAEVTHLTFRCQGYDSRNAEQEKVTEAVKAEAEGMRKMVDNVQKTWVAPEVVAKLREEAEKFRGQAQEAQRRFESLSRDFMHLAGTRDAVRKEQDTKQHQRKRLGTMHANLQSMVIQVEALESRCCDVSTSCT